MPPPTRAALAIGIPTFNRPTDCVATLRAIADDAALDSVVTTVVVPDMGEAKVRHQPGYAEVAHRLGNRLRIVDQPNLGGSGGFARILHETLTGTDCEQILFMDDDVVVEPDVILRALAFARYSHGRVLVGGQMLNIPDRSTLHAMGEVFDRRVFLWREADGTEPEHDLARAPLRATGWLHRRIDVDYNAWWMCLVPRGAAERLGLPLPLFIKWDDCEYGLRAAAAGYPTVTLPGVGVWHMSFADKDDQSDWRGYFLVRNRLVVAALHADTVRPVGMIASMLRHAFGRLLLLEYSSVALQHRAIRDFLAGPTALRAGLPTVLADVRAVQDEYRRGTTAPADISELPPAPRRRLRQTSRIDRLGRAWAFGRTIVHNLRPARPSEITEPVPHVSGDVHWYEVSGADEFVVSGSAGSPVLRRRDPALFRAMLFDTLRQHARLARRFPAVRRRFRAAAGELTGPAGWRELFGSGSVRAVDRSDTPIQRPSLG